MLTLVKTPPEDVHDFYANLPALPEYAQMVDARFYRDLPDEWVIVMTDVRGSTKAIEAGRYKEVNMVGVSTIVAVQNALPDFSFPFVFGGDGATLAVPGDDLAVVKRALSLVRSVAMAQFEMTLRVALIPVRELRGKGAQVRCAKLQISPTQTLALVRGDGWALAETLMKEHEDLYALPADAESGGVFTGLECRWNPLPARKSEVMALIVQARVAGGQAETIFRDILADAMDEDNKPIRRDSIKLRWPPKYLGAEARIRVRGAFQRAYYYLTNLVYVGLQVLYVMWRERPAGRKTPIVYLRELTENTDYVKFDECLRMVIDISEEQKARLIAKLDAYTNAGQIDYGYHSDRNALMTCFIEGPGKHIHFVDAGGGGYAMAAKKLKEAKRRRA